MNIELRNIQTFDKMSEETVCFIASLYINGKKVGWAKNEGRGGNTYFGPDDHTNWEIINKADQYCKTLEPIVYGNVKIPSDLENYIDYIVYEFVNDKEIKRFKKMQQKDQLKALLIGNDTQYKQISWPKKGKTSYTIAELLESESGRKSIQNTIREYRRMMSPSEKILNTNIPKELL